MSLSGAIPRLCTTFPALRLMKFPLTLNPRKSITPPPVSLTVPPNPLLTELHVPPNVLPGISKLPTPILLNPLSHPSNVLLRSICMLPKTLLIVSLTLGLSARPAHAEMTPPTLPKPPPLQTPT